MIFVTVGTHEQPFNRLIQEVDHLVETGVIKEEVFIQTGYSTYEPKFCQWSRLISFDQMSEFMQKADIIITHGGPATFMSAIANGKKPIVVPRQEKFGEHVNDHQIDFCEKVNSRFNNIYLVNNTNELRKLLTSGISFKTLNGSKGNTNFISNFTKEINSLVGKD
ncbi:multidrug MFS transporter [Streptococcus gallolyticus subsp. gallolyticus]|uniref:glycosyltransferase n=1 Tax=Streptococcus gallolyticus TaxID=315405 RepID=UPI000210B8EA|nr:glycosyltransferase [Streptococcus gallolyticus]KJE99969.1 multidrug MFS transporter [Streptococcus gallolyticus subsp. gallolyticus]MCY7157998.1 multidrug MFS transporter [Streptococcus gallolyticus subsp. gallolyticus]BAK27813.1 glycosyltransferase in exopolysaccharide biosynthesis [Streptococcus gallolyticus subsp. gallolyticus ATCC 43143]